MTSRKCPSGVRIAVPSPDGFAGPSAGFVPVDYRATPGPITHSDFNRA